MTYGGAHVERGCVLPDPYPVLDRFGPAVGVLFDVAIGVFVVLFALWRLDTPSTVSELVTGFAVLILAASVAPLRAALRRPPMRAYLEA